MRPMTTSTATSIPLDHKLDMSAGHDEYWSQQMRDGWEAARAAGVNLAFMGADTGNWQIGYRRTTARSCPIRGRATPTSTSTSTPTSTDRSERAISPTRGAAS